MVAGSGCRTRRSRPVWRCPARGGSAAGPYIPRSGLRSQRGRPAADGRCPPRPQPGAAPRPERRHRSRPPGPGNRAHRLVRGSRNRPASLFALLPHAGCRLQTLGSQRPYSSRRCSCRWAKRCCEIPPRAWRSSAAAAAAQHHGVAPCSQQREWRRHGGLHSGARECQRESGRCRCGRQHRAALEPDGGGSRGVAARKRCDAARHE
mmetsp:Transcript_49543/g.127886  ORF Transcript_49543/g.127886 Transcript_49543/m.127886 type:complete len:206 (-) Transcript_49543:355-972(-)